MSGGGSRADPARLARSPPGAWRLLAPALLGWAVAAWAVTAPGSGGVVAVVAACCGALLLLVVLAVARGGRRPVVGVGRPVTGAALVACAVLVLLGARIAAEEQVRADPSLVSAAERGIGLAFAARVTGFPESRASPFGERHWVRAAVSVPRGEVPVLLWLPEAPEAGWGPGLRVLARGTVERLAPGDAAAYAVSVRELRAAERQPAGAAPGAVAAGLRLGLRERAAGIPGAELVPGFAVGDTSLVDEELDAAMIESSLSHLTAVSGANCALVTGAAIRLLGRLGVGRRWRVAAAGAALAGFVALVGPDPSVRRAAVMAAVLLASGFGGRRAVALPALGLAVAALLAADPWQALQPGFALSVAATAGILLAAAPLARWLRRAWRLPRPLALAVAVALAAQLACGPLLLLLQPGIPAVGVLANVLAAPAAPLGTGLGLLALLADPLAAIPAPGGAAPAERIASALVLLASLPARWVEVVARGGAALPLARWHWPEGWPGMLLLTACEAGLLLAWALRSGRIALPAGRRRAAIRVEPRRRWEASPPAPRQIRVLSGALLGAAAGLFLAVTLAVPAAERLGTPRGWAVVACDVGQGDAILLRDPSRPHETMLVDTGDDPESLERCLDRFGVRRIALLVLSHDDRDHVGALGAVVGRVDAALISPTVRGETQEGREVVRILADAGVPSRIGAAGEGRTAPGPGLDWLLLAPEAGRTPEDANAASLVLAVRAGSARVLLLADTGLDEQQPLRFRAPELLRADVLKVAHHGSRDQDPGLPAAVGARWALVSVGAGNGYGHPAAETLAELSRAGARVLRTDRAGSVALVPDPRTGELEAWLEHAPASSGEPR